MPADEIFELSADLNAAGPKVIKAVFSTFKEESETFAEEWRTNASVTSGRHGKHYPKSITAEMKVSTSIVAEVGPETRRKQGGMGRGFEFGGPKQPPHLDGARALPAAERRLEQAVADEVERLLP